MRVLLGTALYQSKHSAITGNIHTGFELGTEFLRNYVKSMRLHTCQGTEEQSPQTVLLLNITPFLPIMKKKKLTFLDFNMKTSHTYIQL